MTDQNANVILTADTSGYTQGVQQAQVSTDRLISSVDALSSKLDGITKRAGKKLVLFGAADLAALTGAVALAAKYESQTKTLEASLAKGQGTIKQYSQSIDAMARSIPVARGEIASLYTQLTQLGVKGPEATENVAKSMLRLSAVTGESVGALTDNMVQLARQMNTLSSGSGAFANFSDSLFTVSKSAGVSATGVLSFAQNMAPFARAAGIGEKSLIGISAAFNAAGADGYAAANTFNTMVADITRSIQNGSPDISKYSNLIGVTVDQFKKMDATERITKIFDAINAQGPRAIRTLDQLGYDGIRAAKAIQGVAQSGNMNALIAQATASYGDGSTSATAEHVSWSDLDSQLKRMSSSVQQVGADIGSAMLTPATAVATAFANALDHVTAMATPLLKVGGLMAGLVGGGAVGVGGAMAALGPLSNVALGAYLLRSRPVRGLLGGFAGGLHEGSTGMAPTQGMGGRMAGLYAADMMPWYQRRIYEASRGFGLALGAPNLGGANYLGRVLSTPFRAATWLARSTEDFYTDSRLNGEDRPVAMGGRQRFYGNAIRDFRITGATAEQRRLYRANVEDSLSRFRSGAIDEAALKAEIAAHQRAAKAAIMAAGSLDQVAISGKEAARAMVGAARQNLMSGASNIGGVLGKVGDGLMSLAGGGAGLALFGGMAAYGLYTGAQEAHNAATPEGSQNPISDYNAKLGLATDSLSAFNASLSVTTRQYDSASSALNDLATAARNAAGNPTVTSSVLTNLPNNDTSGGLAFLRGATGGLTTKNANEVTADLIRRFGYDGAQQILKQYDGNSQFGGADVSALLSSADIQNSGPMRWLHGGVTDAGNALSGDIGGSINQTVASIATTNPQRAGQVNASLSIEALARIASAAAKGQISDETASQAVKNLENTVFGGDINYSTTAWSGSAAMASGKTQGELTPEDFMKWLRTQKGQGNFAPALGKWLSNQQQGGFNPWMSVSDAYSLPASLTNEVQAGIDRTRLGGIASGSSAVQFAMGAGYGSPMANTKAIDDLIAQLSKSTGGDPAKMVAAFEELNSQIGDSTNRLSQLSNAAYSAWRVLQGFQQTGMSAGQIVGQNIQMDNAVLAQTPTDANAENQSNARLDRAKTLQGVMEYYKQYALALSQFQTQMKRSQAAYDLQVERSQESFGRQQMYAEKDFYRQRLWAQEDFNTSMKRAAEDAAKTVYNPWQRVYSQLTSGAANMRDNLAEQNDELSKQLSNLKKAHQLGLSETTIRTLDLANPQNAQQLDALIADMIANPAFVRQINAQAARRLSLSKALTQNNDNSSYANAVADFRKQQRRNDVVFKESMSRAQSEFGIAMANMAEDHGIAVKNAREDMNKYGATVRGNFSQIQALTNKMMGDLGVSNQYVSDMARVLAANPGLLALLNDPNFGATTPAGVPGSPGARGGARSSASSATAGMPTPTDVRNTAYNNTTTNRSTTNVTHKTTVYYNNNYYTKTGPVVANNVQAIYNAINAQNKINALQGKKPSAFF